MNDAVENLLREDLRGRTPYGAPQLDVPVRLNTNENSYAVPDDVVAAITASVTETARHLNRYPDREFTELREALAAYLRSQTGVGITPEQVWAGNGSNEVLLHLVQAFGGVGRTALGFTPAYSMHPIITRTTGTTWVDGLRGTPSGVFDLDAGLAVSQVVQHRPQIVFLCSPNNPTGTALTLDVVEAVVDAAPDSLVVVDEAYAEFARPGTPSAMTLLEGRPLLVVTRTMSKAFALAGARVGYLAADPDLVDALRLVRMPYHLSDPTQAVALAAIRHDASLLATVEAIKAQRDRIVSAARHPRVPTGAQRRELRPLRRPRRRPRDVGSAAGPRGARTRRRHPAPPAGHRRHARRELGVPAGHGRSARLAPAARTRRAGGEGMTANRRASLSRATSESKVDLTLDLDGTGESEISTGVRFYDHMLASFAKHSLIDLTVSASGDVDVDAHHTVEDVAIVLGDALREALGDKRGISRFGDATVPLDEALVQAVVDVAGRPYCVHTGEPEGQEYVVIGGAYAGSLTRHVFETLAHHAGIALHIRVLGGRDPHHVVEAQFKAVARALRAAVAIDPRVTGIPSAKGSL